MNFDKWVIIPGDKPVLIVAQHNAPQIREGRTKKAEINTGRLVEEIAKKANIWGAYTTKKQIDPNWHKNAPFRAEISWITKEYKIELVIDIHGKGNSATALLEFQPNRAFIQRYADCLDSRFPVKGFIDDNQETLSEFLDKKRIPAVQIEIQREGRTKRSKSWTEVEDVIMKVILETKLGQNVKRF